MTSFMIHEYDHVQTGRTCFHMIRRIKNNNYKHSIHEDTYTLFLIDVYDSVMQTVQFKTLLCFFYTGTLFFLFQFAQFILKTMDEKKVISQIMNTNL